MKEKTDCETYETNRIKEITHAENETLKKGIVIREKETRKIIKFISCNSNSALYILSGIRRNLDNKNYIANEEFIKESEIVVWTTTI